MNSDITGQIILGRYRVETFIESGGMGAVYRIWDLARSVPLAMKVLHEDLKEDPSVWKMFQREADALKKLAHPHIVPFYGLFDTPQFAFFLEHYVDGQSLKHLLTKRKSALSLRESLIILKALSAALGYAHVNGIVHCDIKPGNVLIDLSGNVYLTDFGIARHSLSTTTTMASAGTPAYMAPEQIAGEPVSASTDVYALGILLFEMLTRRRPFLGSEPESEEYGPSTDQRIYFAQMSLTPTNPANINSKVPFALGQVVLKAMEKDPAQRYAGTIEMFQAACLAAEMDPEELPGHIGPEILTIPSRQSVQPVTQTPARQVEYVALTSEQIQPPVLTTPAPVLPIQGKTRPNRTILLATGIAFACLVMVIVVVFGAAILKGYRSVVEGRQVNRTPTPTNAPLLAPTKATAPTLTLTPSLPTLAPSSTAIAAPKEEIPPSSPTAGLSTEEVQGYLAPLYSPIPGCAQSHIHLKDWVMVTFGAGRNSIRSTPDTHPTNNKIGVVEPGELVYVIEGPVCNYGWLLWKVRTPTNLEGWTPETDGLSFFLEPFPSWTACPDSPRSLLHKGDQAQVTQYPPISNRVRSKPGTSATQIGNIAPGKKVTLLDGPQCSDKMVWWQVLGEDGLTGWTAEGDSKDDYLVPVPKKHH